MKHLVLVSAAALAIAGMGMVTADSRSYINVTGDQLLMCDFDGAGSNQGGVCFESGHITADPNGQATVTLTDDFTSPASMFICQDFNGDGICPEGPGESSVEACGSYTLTDGVDWNSGAALLIWVDGLVFGNPAISVCGTLSNAVQGSISHT
jgi:hypothetical protein